jgi:predicted Rossmann fold nucleotide-binding protein DprA/Smf involved in DNA uptake
MGRAPGVKDLTVVDHQFGFGKNGGRQYYSMRGAGGCDLLYRPKGHLEVASSRHEHFDTHSRCMKMERTSSFPKLAVLKPNDEQYPPLLRRSSGSAPVLSVIGSPSLLLEHSLGLICSRRCPGSVILRMYDLVQSLKLRECTLVGGFHSPMERECLEVLSQGRASVIVCPARGLRRMRLTASIRSMLAEGRIIIVSPFDPGIRRSTHALARARNRFVGSLSEAVLIAHAVPGSMTDRLARELLSMSKPVFTFDDPSNSRLLRLGAKVFETSAWPMSRHPRGDGEYSRRGPAQVFPV